MTELTAPHEHTFSFPEKRLALVVGVDTAPDSGEALLQNAVGDANAIAEVLRDYCGFTLINDAPILNEQATSTILNDRIRELARKRNDNDFLLFYFSGHAVPLPVKHGDDIYLVTHDFSPLDAQEDENRHISFKWLWERLYQGNNAGKVVIILDCCFAGNLAIYGDDLNLNDILRRLREYFDNVNFAPGTKVDGLRQTLAATGYDELASDRAGRMTKLLVQSLKGEADEAINPHHQVTLYSICEYLHSQQQSANLSGNNANQECILAYHQKRTPTQVNARPNPHFPYEHDPRFRPREDELEQLDTILLESSPIRLGLTGIGGVGKSLLARELVCRHRKHFIDGVFWVTAAEQQETDVQHSNPLIGPLAILAKNTGYLPPGEDSARPDEEQRARHVMRFLARQPGALLILDNLDDPALIKTALPDLASEPLQCAVLYTSRSTTAVEGIHRHQVQPLQKEEDLLHVLLRDTRSTVLKQALDKQNNAEAEAARSICHHVGGLPLALKLLSGQLRQNEWLTLVELDKELRERGVLEVAYDEEYIHKSLCEAFLLSWRRVNSEDAQRMFMLASFFPKAAPIPLWLLSLAAGFNENYNSSSLLTRTRNSLRRLGLIEDVSRYEIQVHPLLRDFGQHMAQEDANGQELVRTAAERVCVAFEDVSKLEQRARDKGFWDCLDQVRVARTFVAAMGAGLAERLKKIERWLDRETFFLGTSGLWPDKLPGLFYQQMYNRMLEEQAPLSFIPSINSPWLRQLERVGIKEQKGLIRVFSGHSGSVTSAAFSPDGSRVVTGSKDKTARIFDTNSGKMLHMLYGHQDVISHVAFSLDGAYVATGSLDCTARLWDAENGALIRIFSGHKGPVNDVAFSPDHEFMVTGSDDSTACLWEWKTGQIHATFSIAREQEMAHDVLPTHLWSANSETYRDDEDDDTDIIINEWAVNCVTCAPDGVFVALGIASGSIYLWNVRDNSHTLIQGKASSSVNCISFSHDGQMIVAGFNNSVVELYDSKKMSSVKTLVGHTQRVENVAFSHDLQSSLILTGSWDRTVCLWDTHSGRLLHKFEEIAGVINSVAFSPDNMTILIGASDMTARLWSTPIVQSVASEKHHNNSIYNNEMVESTRAAFSVHGTHLFVTYSDCSARLWDMQSNKVLKTFHTAHQVQHCAFSSDGTMLITSYFYKHADVWNIHDSTPTRTLKGHSDTVCQAAFSPDGHYILTGSGDRTARLWSVATGRTIKVFTGHTGAVLCVAFSSDGKFLLTGSADGTARLWKQRGREYQPLVLAGHDSAVTSVAFSLDCTKAITGCVDKQQIVWDVATGKQIDILDCQSGYIFQSICSPNGKFLLMAGIFDQIRIWNLEGSPPFQLSGAFVTNKGTMAVCWQGNQHILLVDDELGVDRKPRLYKLRLEGFES